MLDKPIVFILINIVAYFTAIYQWGIGSSIYVLLLITLFIITYNTKYIGLENALSLAIVYLLVFDSDIFTFTQFNFRMWYFLLLVVIFIKVLKFFIYNKYFFKWGKKNIVIYCILTLLFLLSVKHFIFESFETKLYIIKYWLFNVGLIVVLYKLFKSFKNKHIVLFDYFLSIFMFICIWGIIQYYFNINGIYIFKGDNNSIRPFAFFSETTWYSEYIVFGIVLGLLRSHITSDYRFLIIMPLFLLGVIVSATRNSYIGLFLYLFLIFTFIFITQKINIKIFKNFYGILTIFLMILGIILLWKYINPMIKVIIDKFHLIDPSGYGRIGAFKMSMNDIAVNPVFGQGFAWNKSMSTITGTALGAKSFNLFFMIMHIFGLIGFIPFVFLLIIFYYRAFRTINSIFSRYAVIFFTIFISMSMFAPIHQYPFGFYIIALSLYLLKMGNLEYNCKIGRV